jgi:hypothetical protein
MGELIEGSYALARRAAGEGPTHAQVEPGMGCAGLRQRKT